MTNLARLGISHVIDMQLEFDDTDLGDSVGIEVLWNPIDDDFQPKSAEIFQRGIDFAENALQDPDAKVFIHCAAGVHRAPMMTLALLCSQGWDIDKAMEHLQTLRPVVDFAEVYVESVRRYLQDRTVRM
jgi:protein-tyrosine phosphatase